ncbi:DUF1330 domain-containing protein [Streptomyces chryseus]|uniref:DUF1330 domain-containing protein n=1 Tax=Streptomyces chryseus TaxID=68186 RepID=A0ABQ3DLS4_9ACTN|nr:DUF1330 domain-containing protein [Streptomyces chryseus]GGX24631.1 hypothetical protein GCM10010353_44580 [Streptomyces chryseus]GHB04414.1 hypothetical protein GCM10010346_29260 [Streptomyces chryseus]
MSAYAVGHLRAAAQHEDIFVYMERIQATLAPFGGQFLVHGTGVEALEGEWHGNLVVIGFPDMAKARDWYDSEAYQEILPLRTRHVAGEVVLVEGVAPGYDAADTAARLRQRHRAA